jgi:hypothetical protein
MTQRPLAVSRALRESPIAPSQSPTRPVVALPQVLRDPWVAASLAGALVLLALIAVFGQDAGVIWDEGYQLEYGERVLRWFKSGFRDRSAMEYLDLYLYGGLWDVPAQLIVRISPFGPFETRHLLSGLTALVGIYGTWKLAAAVGGSRAGFFAAAMLALTPAWIGHGLFNPKDIPFGAASVFVTLSAVRTLLAPRKVTWRDAAWAGVALGVALGIRPGGFFLASYPVGAIVWRGVGARFVRGVAVQLAIVFVIAWPIMIATWPWAQLSPLVRPLEAMAAASHFNWNGEVLFDGQFVLATQLPPSYLPVWFGITLPEIYWVAALVGLVCLWKAIRARELRSWLGTGMIAVSAVLPLVAAIVTRPTLYDAHRHFLFLVPPLAALAGIALASFTRALEIPKAIRSTVLGVWLFAAVLVVVAIVQLHPYEYVFFNRSVGGLRGAVGRYETDYWGASYREGLAWTAAHVSADRRLRVAGCDSAATSRLYYYLQRWPEAQKRLVLVDSPRYADIYLAVTRVNCHRRVPAEVLHVIGRQNAPLLYVLHPKQQ